MNHTSLNLTKGLLSVSDWNDTPDLLVKFKLQAVPMKLPNMDRYDAKITTLSGMEEWRLPYYDADYLLRRMPGFITLNNVMYFLGLQVANANEDCDFIAAYYHYRPVGPGTFQALVYQQQKATTPQDALAKLAFRLFMDDIIWKIKPEDFVRKGKKKNK